MKRIKLILHISSVITLVGIIALPLSYQFRHDEVTLKQAVEKTAFPAGRQIYAIAQAAEVWPKILETRIDPLDVHVGMTQTLEVVVQSPRAIASVTAKIEHDYGYDDVELTFVEQVATTERQVPFRVTSNGEVVLPGSSEYALVEEANAQTEYPKYLYRATWLVHSTHDTTYETVFKAVDVDGESNEIVMAWSDACGIPAGGDFTLSSPCTISAVDGVDNGSITVNSSLTLNANFAFNSGRSFIIGSGSVAVCSGCEIKKTNIWVTDADGDTYPGVGMTLADGNPGSATRRYLASGTSDCYDGNANARPGQGGFFTTDRGDGSFDYDCDTSQNQQYPDVAECKQNAPECNDWNTYGWWPNGPAGAYVPACGEQGTIADFCADSGFYPYQFNCVMYPQPQNSATQACR